MPPPARAIAPARSTAPPINPAAIVAQPENVTDYEVGHEVGLELCGMPVRANIDGYYSDYHDIQTLVSAAQCHHRHRGRRRPCTQAAYNANDCLSATNDNVTLNAKTAHIYGAEWDVTAIPLPGLTLNASGSYLDARYTDFTYTPPPGYLLPTGTTNLSGTPFPLPAWQTNETVDLCHRPARPRRHAGRRSDASPRIITGRAAISPT